MLTDWMTQAFYGTVIHVFLPHSAKQRFLNPELWLSLNPKGDGTACIMDAAKKKIWGGHSYRKQRQKLKIWAANILVGTSLFSAAESPKNSILFVHNGL